MSMRDQVSTCQYVAEHCLQGDRAKEPPYGGKLHPDITTVEVYWDPDGEALWIKASTRGGNDARHPLLPHLFIIPEKRSIAASDIEPAVWQALEQCSAQLAN